MSDASSILDSEDLIINSTLTVDEYTVPNRLAQALSLFEEIDVHQNGYITFDELRTLMLQNDPDANEEEIKSVYSGLVQGDDETISKKAFIEGLRSVYSGIGELEIDSGSKKKRKESGYRLNTPRHWVAGHVLSGLRKSTSTRRESLDTINEAQQLAHALFSCLDTDGNGLLPLDELKQALTEVDPVFFSADTLDEIMGVLDGGNTGSVTEDEFTEGFAIIAATDSLDELKSNIENYRIEKSITQPGSGRPSLTMLYGIEVDFNSDTHTYEDVHSAHTLLEDQTGALKLQLKQAKQSAEKLRERYLSIQKENLMHYKEKQQLAKELQYTGTMVKNLEENEDVYKKMCESMQTRIQQLEEGLLNNTNEKNEVEEILLMKQRGLEIKFSRELSEKQREVEREKKIVLKQRKEARAIKQTLLHDQRITEKKISKKSKELTKAQTKIQLLENQLKEKQQEYNKFKEMVALKTPRATPKNSIGSSSKNTPQRYPRILLTPGRGSVHSLSRLSKSGTLSSICLERVVHRLSVEERKEEKKSKIIDLKSKKRTDSLNNTLLEDVLKKLKLWRHNESQKPKGSQIKKSEKDHFFCDIFSELFFPADPKRKSKKLNKKNNTFFLVCKYGQGKKSDFTRATVIKRASEMQKIIEMEKKNPSGGTFDWEKSFYLGMIMYIFQYKFVLAISSERPVWDQNPSHIIQAIHYLSLPVEASPTHTPRNTTSPTQHTFPTIYFDTGMYKNEMKDIVLQPGQYLAIRLSASLQIQQKKHSNSQHAHNDDVRSYKLNLFQGKASYADINRSFFEVRSGSLSYNPFSRNQEMSDSSKTEYLTLKWKEGKTKGEGQLAIKLHTAIKPGVRDLLSMSKMDTAVDNSNVKKKKMRSRSKSTLSKPSRTKRSKSVSAIIANTATNWWKPESSLEDIAFNTELTFISVPWTNITNALFETVLQDLE